MTEAIALTQAAFVQRVMNEKCGKTSWAEWRKTSPQKANHPTGGVLPLKTSIYSDIIVDIFGEDSLAFTGLVGAENGGTDLEENTVSPGRPYR